MRVRLLPCSRGWLQSQYLSNLIAQLPDHGVDVVVLDDSEADWIGGRWLEKNKGEIDILHFHWTDYNYTRHTWFISSVELARFIGKLLLARRYRYKLIWTMHNYMPHEKTYPLLHYLERLAMAHLSDSVIVHCQAGKQLVLKRLFRKNRVFSIPHGDYGKFLNRIEQAEARARIGIPERVTVLIFFGAVRPYKGVSQLVQAFRKIHDNQLILLVVGRAEDKELADEIRHLVSEDNRILINLTYVPDSELAEYLCAADVAVLPYTDILTSGAAITALSFGLPVIAPGLGCLPEVVKDGCGILYDPRNDVLDAVIQQCLAADLGSMRVAALARSRELSWDSMVLRTAEVYRIACGDDIQNLDQI